jgi:hypothetical protein
MPAITKPQRQPEDRMKNFGVGMDKAVHAARRRLEDRIARIVFKKKDRLEVVKYVMWEKIITSLEQETDESLKRIFGDGE